MSFFNFRRAGSSSAPNAASAAQTESVEVIRKRAKHRLIGSAVLILAGIVGFPLLFDTQPRPIAVDIPIEIPSKNTVKPLASAAEEETVLAVPVSAASAPLPRVPEKVAAASSLAPKEEIIQDKKPVVPAKIEHSAIKTEVKPVPKAEIKPETKPEVKAEVKPAVKPAEPRVESKPAVPADDGARAKALLDGKVADTATAAIAHSTAAGAELRLIVQVGAFADVVKAREARLKLEKAGMKTYTQVAETTAGKRIRVRVGPFATKAEAEKAASKVRTLDLPAAILTL